MILPVLLEHVEVPPLLRDIQWLDLTDGNVDKAVQRIVETIEKYSITQSSPEKRNKVSGSRISENKIVTVLAEERGVVGSAAKRLGISPKRLYQLLKYYNIQLGSFVKRWSKRSIAVC